MLNLLIHNVDFPSLSASPRLLAGFRTTVRDVVAEAAGGINGGHVGVTLSAGSVAARAAVRAPGKVDTQILLQRLREAAGVMAAALAQRLSDLDGIADISTGSISVGGMLVNGVALPDSQLAALREKAAAGASTPWYVTLGNILLAMVIICFCLPFCAGVLQHLHSRPRAEMGTGTGDQGYHRSDEWYKPVMVMDQMPPLLPPGVGGLLPPPGSGGQLSGPVHDWAHHAHQDPWPGPDSSYAPWIQEPVTRPASGNQPLSPMSAGFPLHQLTPTSATSGHFPFQHQVTPTSATSGHFPLQHQMDLLGLPLPDAAPMHLQPQHYQSNMLRATGPGTAGIVERMLSESTAANAGQRR